jgi:hypothetical protein
MFGFLVFFKDLVQTGFFCRTLDFGFSLDVSSFIRSGLAFLWTLDSNHLSIILNDTNIQSDSSQCKRINAIFLYCCIYGHFRRIPMEAAVFYLIFLGTS